MKKIAIITNVIPTYREHFYDLIFNNPNYDINVFCHDKINGINIKTSHSKFGKKIVILNKISSTKRIYFIWQFLPIYKLYSNYDVIVVDGNLRHISQALLSTIFKLIGKKIIIWSNVYTFGGNPFLQKIRINWWKLFDNFLMYTEKDVERLLEFGFNNKNIRSINNGLCQNVINFNISKWNHEQLLNFKKLNNIKTNNIIISSGRINKVNDIYLAYDAVKHLKEKINDILWVVIGQGSEFEKLQDLIEADNLHKNIILLGEIYDEKLKTPWFLISKVFIHAGPIGLSLFNAFGYSLPVVTHDNSKYHGPEFVMFQNGKTGYVFEYKNSKDFSAKIHDLLLNSIDNASMGSYSYKIVSEKYNTNQMANEFFKMVQTVI
jgi:glycosyltransferase involved in cell wall biosynthesis